jgi:hypothetical protein
MPTVSQEVSDNPRLYQELSSDVVAGRQDLALIALRQPGRLMNTGIISPTWHTVPANLKDGILLILISTGFTSDFRVLYELKLVPDARALRTEHKRLELLCMALHPRVGRGVYLGRLDAMVMQMVFEFAGV